MLIGNIVMPYVYYYCIDYAYNFAVHSCNHEIESFAPSASKKLLHHELDGRLVLHQRFAELLLSLFTHLRAHRRRLGRQLKLGKERCTQLPTSLIVIFVLSTTSRIPNTVCLIACNCANIASLFAYSTCERA